MREGRIREIREERRFNSEKKKKEGLIQRKRREKV